MRNIILNEILISSEGAPEAAARLYDDILLQTKSQNKAIIDMQGVTSLSSVFLNVSIGKIIDDFGIDFLKKSVSFVNITQMQANRLKEYLERYSSL